MSFRGYVLVFFVQGLGFRDLWFRGRVSSLGLLLIYPHCLRIKGLWLRFGSGV